MKVTTRWATGLVDPATPAMTASPPTPTSPGGCCGATSGLHNALDVGYATGYLVEVLRELGVDAVGCDLSPYAVDHATPGAVGHIRVASLFSGLPWPDGYFELVTVLETLDTSLRQRAHRPP